MIATLLDKGRVAFLLVLFLLHVAGVRAAGAETAPIPQQPPIRVLSQDQAAPQWKSLWDRGRKLAAEGDLSGAATAYGELFSIRPQLEQASWEYCRILLQLGDYGKGAKVVQALLERKPANADYLFAGGTVAMANGDWQAALRYFGHVLELEPTGARSEKALEGVMISLRRLGRREMALGAAERLLARRPNDLPLQKEMAEEARALGQLDKAGRLLRRLVDSSALDTRTMAHLVSVFDQPQFAEERAALYEKYLAIQPAYAPFRKKLVNRYLQLERYDDALRHLTVLAENDEDGDAYLLQAGRVAYRQAKRPDKALAFLERYVQRHPEDDETTREVTEIRRLLAEDFLAIVENDGARPLWHDLQKITSHRLEIFREVARLLQMRGQGREYREVLSIIHEHYPQDTETSLRLARLFHEEGSHEAAGRLLEGLGAALEGSREAQRLRAEVAVASGEELVAFSALEAAWRLDSGDRHLLRLLFELSGSLGDIKKLRQLFEQGMESNRGRVPDPELILFYLSQLDRNHLFHEFMEVLGRYQATLDRDPAATDRSRLLQASALRRQGRNDEAEQLLRSLLLQGRSPGPILAMLAEMALESGNAHAARTWIAPLRRLAEEGGVSRDVSTWFESLLLAARLARIEGDAQKATELLSQAQTALGSGQSRPRETTGAPQELRLPSPEEERHAALHVERGWLSWQQGNNAQTKKLLAEIAEYGRILPEYYILSAMVGKGVKGRKAAAKNGGEDVAVAGRPPLRLVPQIIEGLLLRQEYQLAREHLRMLLRYNGDSLLARALQARIDFVSGQYQDTASLLEQLIRRQPEEEYFRSLRLALEVKNGNYRSGLELWERYYGPYVSQAPPDDGKTAAADSPAADVPGLTGDSDRLLTLARLLWGERRHGEALAVYRRLLFPTVEERLEETFRQKQIALSPLLGERRWWDSLLFVLRSTPDMVGQLMDGAFLLDNLGSEVGPIVTSYYHLYNLQKLIRGEYQSRQAIFEKNFAAAEQRSKKVVEEQQSAEGMIDLAAIYGRIGKYRKEAQVYEALQNAGTTSPQLQASMERSSQQLSPQNILDTTYGNREGREGSIDVEIARLGTSFSFTPNLDTEVLVSYASNHYRSVSSSDSASGNSIYGKVMYEFARDYELQLGGGGHKIDGDSSALLLHEMTLKGRLDEYFSALVEWRKEMVEDTVASILGQTTFQQFGAEITCETPIGITFGGDFRHRNYSDDNSQNRFHAFSSYGVYGDAIYLAARYDYQYLANSDDRIVDDGPSEVQPTALASPLESLYWRPSFWSEHLAGVTLQHDFLAHQQGEKRRSSYYRIVNGVGVDDQEDLSYQGKFDIFLEMTPHFLLKGNFTLFKSDAHEEKWLAFSLHYRW